MEEKTMAKKVHEEFAENLDAIYSWQYQDFNLISTNYNIILQDIETYWNQEARFREGFVLDKENKNITVPNFCTKINGVHKDIKDYKEFINFIKNSKNTFILDNKFSFSSYQCVELTPTICVKNSNKFFFKKEDIENSIEDNTKFDFAEPTVQNILNYKFLNYIINSKNFTFNLLTSCKREQLLKMILNYIEKNIDNLNEDKIVKFLKIAFSIPSDIITYINNFDYSFDVPKIVVTKKEISEDLSILLNILNEFAFDILFLEPSGKSTIEKYLDVNNLSLGYFNTELNIEDDILYKERYEQEEKERKKEDIKETFLDCISNSWKVIVILLVIAINIGIWFFPVGGTILTITQIVSGVILGLMCMHEEESEIIATTEIALVVILILILIGRFLFWGITTDSTTIKDGYLNIEETAIECESGFIIQTKDNAVIDQNSTTLYLYAENNANNTEDCYVKLFIGNTEIYESPKIKPLEYLHSVSLNTDLPIGENKVIIKYYLYDTEPTDSETYKTDILLGEKEITVHCTDNNKNYNELKEQFGFE